MCACCEWILGIDAASERKRVRAGCPRVLVCTSSLTAFLQRSALPRASAGVHRTTNNDRVRLIVRAEVARARGRSCSSSGGGVAALEEIGRLTGGAASEALSLSSDGDDLVGDALVGDALVGDDLVGDDLVGDDLVGGDLVEVGDGAGAGDDRSAVVLVVS